MQTKSFEKRRLKMIVECKREGCHNDISANPYWAFLGYCSRSCHLKDKKQKKRKENQTS